VVVANLYSKAVAAGLKAASPVPATLRLSRSYLKREPFWFAVLLIVIGVVFGSLNAGPIVWVPILLGVALLVFGRTKETVTLVVSAAEGGTTVAATGSATGRLAEFVDGVYS